MTLTRQQRSALGRTGVRVCERFNIEPACPQACDVVFTDEPCGCVKVHVYFHAGLGAEPSASRATAASRPCPCGAGLTLQPKLTVRSLCDAHIATPGSEAFCDLCVEDGFRLAQIDEERRHQEAAAERATAARAEFADRQREERDAQLAAIRAQPPSFDSRSGCGCRVVMTDDGLTVERCEAHTLQEA